MQQLMTLGSDVRTLRKVPQTIQCSSKQVKVDRLQNRSLCHTSSARQAYDLYWTLLDLIRYGFFFV